MREEESPCDEFEVTLLSQFFDIDIHLFFQFGGQLNPLKAMRPRRGFYADTSRPSIGTINLCNVRDRVFDSVMKIDEKGNWKAPGDFKGWHNYTKSEVVNLLQDLSQRQLDTNGQILSLVVESHPNGQSPSTALNSVSVAPAGTRPKNYYNYFKES
eukprot:GHVO01017110.1.p1 GENE.GHVO01017110.1~~GHVO01017110.1.p1  ORF type:complete len:170 (+),score=29.58 GHVO01017110.1:45-512(+)